MVAVTSLLPLVLVGCITHENTLSESDKQDLPERFDTVAPDLGQVDISAGGDGFNMQDNLRVDACPDRDVTVKQTRAQVRKIARVVWNHAETSWEDLTIDTYCRDDLETRRSSRHTEGLKLEMTVAGANQLWGESTDVDHDSRSSPRRRSNAKEYEVFGPEPRDGSRSAWWDVHVPHGASKKARREDLDQITETLWHEHPGRLAGIGIHAVQLPPSDRTDDSKSLRKSNRSGDTSTPPSNYESATAHWQRTYRNETPDRPTLIVCPLPTR